ncbi:fatty acid--CoA ligase family protein [Sphingobium sp. H39-3-25]|uniref:class I adenylate-forming enzyme family protein n=1 Tax=Sphingobium arseniciresistens TaxID=3030834 RepID=UPI0023B903B0|nr:fatty acid--CoA ligase family protein [Sphingobium arseniciresistens]
MSLDRLSAEALLRAPDGKAIIFGERCYVWRDVRRVAEDVRVALQRSGIAADAPVAFVSRNRPAALAALLALIAQRRTIRMIYAFQSATGIARDIDRLTPSAVIAFREDFSPEVRDALGRGGITAVALDEMAAAPLAGFERAGTAAQQQTGPAEPQIQILTSGTTGPPKPFAVSYALLERHFLASPLARQQGEDPQASPPFLLYFPLGNISGLYSTLPMLIRGQPVMLIERFTIEAWRDHILRFRPVHSGLPPSAVQMVLDANIPKEALASLRAIGAGAAPLDPMVQAAFEARYGIPILLSYGATEFAGPVAAMTAELHAQWGKAKLGTVGRAMPGAQLRVVDAETGEILPPGAEGLLEVISSRIGPDWIRTSDIARIDSDGFLFLHGRADGAIIRGGFKLIPESIERALMTHPAVSEAAVVGLRDGRLGEVPVAAVRPKPNVAPPSSSALEAHLREHLLATHIPVKWLFCDDFPRTPSLKTDKNALRALFEKPG